MTDDARYPEAPSSEYLKSPLPSLPGPGQPLNAFSKALKLLAAAGFCRGDRSTLLPSEATSSIFSAVPITIRTVETPRHLLSANSLQLAHDGPKGSAVGGKINSILRIIIPFCEFK